MGAVLLACAALAGCGRDGGVVAAAGGQGYISGPGTVRLLDPQSRDPAVELSGPRLGGGDLDVGAYRGEVVVLNVWGSWCPPCRAEAPALQRAWARLQPRGAQFVGINTRDTEAAAQAFERSFGITYPSLVDDDGRALLTFRKTLPPNAIPSTIVLDRDGRVAARVLGATTEAKLTGVVGRVLAEAPSGTGT